MVCVAHAEKMLGVIDAKTFAQKTDIQLPGTAEGFEAEKNGKRLFLNVPDTNEVVVIDTQKYEMIGSYPLKMAGGNHPLALDEANHRIFVGCHKEPKVVILDSDTGKEIASVPIAEDCDDLFFDAKHKRIYVSCSEGYLVTIGQKGPTTTKCWKNYRRRKMPAPACSFRSRTVSIWAYHAKRAKRGRKCACMKSSREGINSHSWLRRGGRALMEGSHPKAKPIIKNNLFLPHLQFMLTW